MLIGFIGWIFDPRPSIKSGQAPELQSPSVVSSPASDTFAPAAPPTEDIAGGALGSEQADEGGSLVDIQSIPESRDPTFCLNLISKARARAGSRWVQEIASDVAAQCGREIEMQRRRDGH